MWYMRDYCDAQAFWSGWNSGSKSTELFTPYSQHRILTWKWKLSEMMALWVWVGRIPPAPSKWKVVRTSNLKVTKIPPNENLLPKVSYLVADANFKLHNYLTAVWHFYSRMLAVQKEKWPYTDNGEQPLGAILSDSLPAAWLVNSAASSGLMACLHCPGPGPGQGQGPGLGMMGLNIMLCTVHTAPGPGLGSIGFATHFYHRVRYREW